MIENLKEIFFIDLLSRRQFIPNLSDVDMVLRVNFQHFNIITKRLSSLFAFRLLPPDQISSTKYLNTDFYENRGLVRALGCLHLKICPVSVCFYSKLFSSSLIDEPSCDYEVYLRASVSKLRLFNKRTWIIKIGIEN